MKLLHCKLTEGKKGTMLSLSLSARQGLPQSELEAIYTASLLAKGIRIVSQPLYNEQLPLDSTEDSIYTLTGYVVMGSNG